MRPSGPVAVLLALGIALGLSFFEGAEGSVSNGRSASSGDAVNSTMEPARLARTYPWIGDAVTSASNPLGLSYETESDEDISVVDARPQVVMPDSQLAGLPEYSLLSAPCVNVVTSLSEDEIQSSNPLEVCAYAGPSQCFVDASSGDEHLDCIVDLARQHLLRGDL